MRWLVRSDGGPGDTDTDTDTGTDIDLRSAYDVPARDQLNDGTCFVRANMASSVDGAIDDAGRSRAVSSDADRALFHLLRTMADVVVVGAGTARAERYGPGRPNPELRSMRIQDGFSPAPVIAVVTASGQLDPTWPLFTEAEIPTLVITSDQGRDAAPELAAVADVVVCGDQLVEVALMYAALAERGLTRVLCEGGPRLLQQLIAADVLDELCLTISPLTVGGTHQHMITGLLDVPAAFPVITALEEDGSVFLRCRRSQPSPATMSLNLK